MEISKQEEQTYRLFRISVFLKGLFSLVEVVGGVLALLVPVSAITGFIISLVQGELTEDPGDFIATHLLQLAQHYSIASGTFIAVYLLSRGFIKIFLVVALLKNQLWAYPCSLVVLGLFVVYQAYQILLAFSPLLILLTIFDLIVMYFIWKEYRIVRENLRM